MNLYSISPPFIFGNKDDPGFVYRGIKEHELEYLMLIKGLKNLVQFEILDETINISGKESRLLRIERVPADIRIQELTKKQAKKLLCDQIDLCIECIKNGVC